MTSKLWKSGSTRFLEQAMEAAYEAGHGVKGAKLARRSTYPSQG